MHLQDALDEVNANPETEYEIRVAEGAYHPDQDSDGDHTAGDEDDPFEIDRDGVTLLGGYPAGGGTRDVAAHATVLSGDIDDNDVTNSDGITENAADINGSNSFHVLHLYQSGLTNTRIDGVTVTAGQANSETAEEQSAGGVYNEGSPVFVRVVLAGNRADAVGGGMRNTGSSPILVNVTLSGNQADTGGGLANREGSPVIINALFTGNEADGGGAMYNFAQFNDISPTIKNTTFAGNTADHSGGSGGGGALHNAGTNGQVEPIIFNTIFWGNETEGGGGDQIKNQGSGAQPAIGSSVLEGGLSAISENNGSSTSDNGAILDQDPQFVDPDGGDDTAGTLDDDLRLQGPGSGGGASPAIDAGANDELPNDETDLDGDGDTSEDLPIDRLGNARIQSGADSSTVDMGMFESDGSPLPVELAAFSAQTSESAVHLTWRTASEMNNAGFEVERKQGGGSAWKKVGFVEDTGTTGDSQNYAFTDADPSYGADSLRYRLRQVDLDGTSTLTDPVVVKRKVDRLELRGAFPNPAREQVTVRFAVPERQEATLRLYDVMGREVRTLAAARRRDAPRCRLGSRTCPAASTSCAYRPAARRKPRR